MKRFRDLSYRNKLLITHLSTVLLVVLAITTLMTLTASQQAVSSHTASLNLLTEQVLLNFISEADAAQQHLYSMSASTGTARQMAAIRSLKAGGSDYLQARQELAYALNRMVDIRAPYDYVAVRLDNGACVSSTSYDGQAIHEAEALLSDPEYAENRYGYTAWVRTEAGNLYLIRDVYSTSPLRHVGKMTARIRQDALVSLGQYNRTLGCAILFFDEGGQLLTYTGEAAQGLAGAASILNSQPADTVSADGTRYAACRHESRGWSAVGLLPMAVVTEVQRSITQSSLLVAALGMLFGLGVAAAVSHQLSGQIRRLVASMNQVAAGDLDVVIPVDSADEIGILTRHFNRMTQKTKELLARVVQEESNKCQAEYQSLEYAYRFLQWQINPHFIYNALETVNAMAKLDGNAELCEMIVTLSAYFRQNAQNMRKRFVTVSQEFTSLRQYADIYRQIYGSALIVTFSLAPEAAQALLPTMILQPLLENALVHGVNQGAQTCIEASARLEGKETLVIQIQDNGPGMPPETAAKILVPQEEARPREERSSLGVRNVLERMRLIYGSQAAMRLTSRPGAGTLVELRLPCAETAQLPKERELRPFFPERQGL